MNDRDDETWADLTFSAYWSTETNEWQVINKDGYVIARVRYGQAEAVKIHPKRSDVWPA